MTTTTLKNLGVNTSAEPYTPGSIEEERENQAKLEARERRMEICGTKASRIDPLSGQWYAYTMYCGHWRFCETCKLRRAQDFKNRFARAAQQTKDQVFLEIVGTKEEANVICRRLQRAKVPYWRVPVDANENNLCDEVYIMFDGQKDQGLGIQISGLDLEWDLLAYTPLEMRSSGKLGVAEQEEKKDEESITVSVPDWSITTPDYTPLERLHAEVQEMVKLDDLKFTRESLALRVDTLEQAMIEVVERHGGEIERRSAKKTVTISAYKSYLKGIEDAAHRKQDRMDAARAPELVQSTYMEPREAPF